MTVYQVPNYYGSTDWHVRTRTAVQSLLTNGHDGDTFVFRDGVYDIDQQLSWSNKTYHLIFERGSVLKEHELLPGPLLYAVNAHDSSITGLTFKGAETVFDGILNSPHYAVEIETSENIVIDTFEISGKSRGLFIDRCDHFNINKGRMNGLIESAVVNNNYHTFVQTSDSRYGQASYLEAYDIGSCYLEGGVTGGENNILSHITGVNCFDNPVYISGGIGDTLSDISVVMTDGKTATNGTGAVKAKGIGHIVEGVNAFKTNWGIIILPVPGFSVDSYGAKGHGILVSDSISRETVNGGFQCGVDTGFLRGSGFFNCQGYACVQSGAAFGTYHIAATSLNAFVYNCLSYGHLGSVIAVNDLGTTTRVANNVVVA